MNNLKDRKIFNATKFITLIFCILFVDVYNDSIIRRLMISLNILEAVVLELVVKKVYGIPNSIIGTYLIKSMMCNGIIDNKWILIYTFWNFCFMFSLKFHKLSYFSLFFSLFWYFSGSNYWLNIRLYSLFFQMLLFIIKDKL